MRKIRIIALLSSIALFNCTEKKMQQVEGLESTKAEIAVPYFNADTAYYYITRQVDFGPRVPNTAAHDATRQFLVDRLAFYGAKVTEQSFDATAYNGDVLKLTNIIASFNPEAKRRVLLAAHWDTRKVADKDSDRILEPIDGANDGGSGVGVLMEIARILGTGNRQPSVGVDIIFFDGEDNGRPEYENRKANDDLWWCLGSRYWSKNKHQADYTAFYGILLDMVGAAGAQFYQEGYSMRYAPGIVRKVWNMAHQLGYSDFFIKEQGPAITDDHVPVNEIAGIPMIDIIDLDLDGESVFRDYHHTHRDNMDIIDKTTLRAVGQTVLHVLYHER
jgi:glutaminyl-peptide cyclotransferase